MENRPIFTGERVVPNNTCHSLTFAEHMIRYSLAMRYAKVGRILDVACGTGYGLKMMGMLGAVNLSGADIDKEAVDFSREFTGNWGFFKTVDFEKEDLSDIFMIGTYDLITSFETIEHLDDPNLFLEGVEKLLAEDGKFIYSIPLANPSKFHKVVYDFESAKKLIDHYFDHEELYIQESLEIVKFERVKTNDLSNFNKRGIFIVGVCYKKQ
ncbi:MAG: class I SAM-dependent methyltransferase [Parcubacteria group bacterium]|jgi:2-polyprenyl-3-methyl-5-hydroxy-6-metoxy-1,4-benzoquinol methylase